MQKKKMFLSALTSLAMVPCAAGAQSIGTASWYGARHQGYRTSSGEVFDQDELTAASRDIPLGSRVRVTLHDTGRSVVVRVNDRMGARGALIDLSRGAAREIGLLGRGVGTVSIGPADDDPVEVAEAPDDAASDSLPVERRRRTGRSKLARPSIAGRRCCHVATVLLARHVIDHHHPVRHRL